MGGTLGDGEWLPGRNGPLILFEAPCLKVRTERNHGAIGVWQVDPHALLCRT
jgi:hypothetical protein